MCVNGFFSICLTALVHVHCAVGPGQPGPIVLLKNVADGNQETSFSIRKYVNNEEQNSNIYNFIFGPFYTLIFTWADM